MDAIFSNLGLMRILVLSCGSKWAEPNVTVCGAHCERDSAHFKLVHKLLTFYEAAQVPTWMEPEGPEWPSMKPKEPSMSCG